VVLINSKLFKSKLPKKFKGIEIIKKDLGKVKKFDLGGKYGL
jgi:hypothetical protein